MGWKIRWYCEGFFTTGDPSKDRCWFLHHPLLRSGISPGSLQLFTWRKCTQTSFSSDYRKEKEVVFTLSAAGSGQKYTLHPHSGAVCSYFWLPPSFLRWMGWCGRLSRVVISLNKYQHGHIPPALRGIFCFFNTHLCHPAHHSRVSAGYHTGAPGWPLVFLNKTAQHLPSSHTSSC